MLMAETTSAIENWEVYKTILLAMIDTLPM
jgi:hypothetical protein